MKHMTMTAHGQGGVRGKHPCPVYFAGHHTVPPSYNNAVPFHQTGRQQASKVMFLTAQW